MNWLASFVHVFAIVSFADAVTHLEIYPGLQCSYNYDLVVHTHRGERSTKELNFKINAKVCLADFVCVMYLWRVFILSTCIVHIGFRLCSKLFLRFFTV